MPLGNPIEAWLQAQQMKNQNQQQMVQDMAGIGQGLGQGAQGVADMIKQQKQKQLMQQIVQAMSTQGTPQQGPQMPTGQAIQGPQGYAPPNQGPNSSAVPAGQMPMPKNPQSGMGGPPQDNTAQMKGLLMQADPKGMMGAMEGSMFPTPPTQLDPSVRALNQAKTAALNRGPQQKLTNPLDDAIKQKKLEMMGLLLKKAQMQSQPKPPNPVPAEALDLRAQIANNQQAPWYKKLGFAGGLKPVKVNSPGQVSSSSSSISDMTDEQLMQLATQGDSQ